MAGTDDALTDAIAAQDGTCDENVERAEQVTSALRDALDSPAKVTPGAERDE